MDYTLKEAAKILDITPGTLRVYLHYGKIQGFKRVRDWFITQESLDQLMQEFENKRKARNDKNHT